MRWWIALLGSIVVSVDPAGAEWMPSPELAFVVTVTPATATVGDPLQLGLRGSGPSNGDLLWPAPADSIGPFSVLKAQDPERTQEGERVTLTQAATVALYRAGEQQLPALPLLWVRAPGETLVAWSAPVTVSITSVLPEDLDVSDPNAALAQLKDVKGVVPVSGPPILRWILGATLAAALVALAIYLYRKRPRRAATVAEPVRTLLPADVAFERGLDALEARRLLETGRMKEFYAALSLLLREYVERRFEIPAVEETRSELLEAAAKHAWFTPSDRSWLSDWLLDSDLVKFAREDRLLSEARERAESARAWVRETTRTARERVAAAALAAGGTAHAAVPTGSPAPRVPKDGAAGPAFAPGAPTAAPPVPAAPNDAARAPASARSALAPPPPVPPTAGNDPAPVPPPAPPGGTRA